jgi:hypothetical protein
MAKSDGGAVGTYSTLASGVNLGEIRWVASGATAFQQAASIRAKTAATTSDTSAPAVLVFETSASGSVTPTSRMEIDQTGQVNMFDVYSDTVGATNRDLFIDSGGKLGYVSSIRASKTEIQDMPNISWLYQLNPVTFKYRKKDAEENYTDEIDGGIQYGLIAEDVEQINPDLVFYDETENGPELRGINYSMLIMPLIKAVQQQQSIIENLTARIEALEANQS